MRVGSLFAGIGGFDLAAERAGHEIVWQSELDPAASRVLDYHWPAVKNLGDIHEIGCACDLQAGVRRENLSENSTVTDNGREHREPVTNTASLLDTGERCEGCGRDRIPGVDVLTGGFPCQDYSVAGGRGGLAGDRGALWWEYHRLIDTCRPTWVVGENVPGLLSSRSGADFETIIGSLTELGYGVAWAVLDAQYFGVAQRRRRVFIVGHSGGEPRPEVLALGEGVFGHPQPRRQTGQDVAGTLAPSSQQGGSRSTDLDGNGAWVLYNEGSQESYRESDSTVALTEGAGSRRLEQIVFDSSRRDGVRLQDDDTVNTLQAQMGTGGLNVPMVAAFMENQRGETWEAPIVQAVNSGGGKPGQGYPAVRQEASVRRLTPLECERLQGFPDNWTDTPGNSDTQRYRQLGNAVAVPVVEWIMRRLEA